MSDEIRVGDRFEVGCDDSHCGHGWAVGTPVLAVDIDGSIKARSDDGRERYINFRCARLPSAKPKAPEPRKGQRWKCKGDNCTYELVQRWYVGGIDGTLRGWEAAPKSYWYDERFSDGTLEYIGEGEAAGGHCPATGKECSRLASECVGAICIAIKERCAAEPIVPAPSPAISAPTGCTLITRSGLQCDLRAGHKGRCDLEPNPYREGPGGVSDAELEALAAGPWRRRS